MDDTPLSQASAAADDDFRNGLPRLPHGNLTTVTKAIEESLGQALSTILLMNCHASVPLERCTPQGLLLQVAAVAGVEWWNALFPSTPLPKEVIDTVPLALFWASTLVRRIVISDTEEWTTAPYCRTTADLHTMAHSPSSTPPAVVALIIAILGAAWNQQGVGTNNELRDKTRPVVGVVVHSKQNVRVAEADAIARRFCMIPMVLLAPCMVYKQKRPGGMVLAAKLNMSLHVHGATRCIPYVTASVMGEQPTTTSGVLALRNPEQMQRHWLYAHRLDHAQNEWASTDPGALGTDTQTAILKCWDERLVQAWVPPGQGTAAVEVILSFASLLFRDAPQVVQLLDRKANDPRLVAARVTWGLIGLGILMSHAAADQLPQSVDEQVQLRHLTVQLYL